MAVSKTDLSKSQQNALGDFLSDWNKLKDNTLQAAKSYKACIDLGMDMSPYISDRGLHDKLLLIASGKIHFSLTQMEVAALPASGIEALSTLPKDEQTSVWKQGVEIWRGDRKLTVAFSDLSPTEIRRAIDTTGGRGRIVSPEEQRDRSTPKKARNDQIIEVRFTSSEATDLFAAAHKAKRSPAAMIKDMARKSGLIK